MKRAKDVNEYIENAPQEVREKLPITLIIKLIKARMKMNEEAQR